MIMQKQKIKLSMILFVSLIASITIATLPSHTVALTYAEVFDAEFDAEMEEFLESAAGTVNPSQAFSFINGTDIAYTEGYGHKPGLDTVFLIGPMSIAFTAVAVLQLYEQGFLDLDANISDILPYELYNPSNPSIPIMIENLLSYTSTITDSDAYWSMSMNETYEFDEMIIELLHENSSDFEDSWVTSATPGVYTESSHI